MKYITLLLTMLLTTVAINTKANNGNLGFADKNAITNTRLAAMQASHSILVKKFDYNKSLMADVDCGKYRSIRTAGAVLLGIGIPSMVAGAAMVAVAYGSNRTGNDSKGIVAFGGAGIGLTCLGAVMTVPGIALAIAGNVKYKKYCKGTTSSTRNFYINPTIGNGVGLAARF